MHTLIAVLLPLVDDVPRPEDVKGGWLFAVVLFVLGVAIAVIGYFLVRSLRRSSSTAEHGGYEGTPVIDDPDVDNDDGRPGEA